MLNKLLFALAFSLTITFYAQEEVVTIKNSLKTSKSDVKDAIPIVNQKNDEVSLFLVDSKQIYGYLIDADFSIKKQRVFENKIKKYDLLIGNSISENSNYRLYLSNDKYSKFISVNFSFENDSTTVKELDLQLKKEKFIETINYDNNFYLLTLSDKEPILNIYVFDKDANYKKHQLNFTNDMLIDKKGKPIIINSLLEQVTKIEENSLNSIDLTSKLSKLIVSGNQLIFSFDQNKDTTQIIAIDINTFDKQIRKLSKPFIDPEVKQKKTNSYVNHQHLFTIAASKDKFTFAIQNLKTGVLLNKYALTAEDTITFKNSSIIQVGAVYENYRELEKTKKFLQKITYGNVGVSAFQIGDNYRFFLGGQHEYRANVAGAGMIKSVRAVELNSGALKIQHFNPTLEAFNLYSNTLSTYIKSLMADNFKHVKGNIKSNAFDKIKDFETDRSNKDIKTVFRYKDHYLMGRYLSETNQYRLRKFKN